MSYKENNDYININLKRQATEDELQLLNDFWSKILPYRFLKKSNKKFFKTNIFGEKELNKIFIKNNRFVVKASHADNEKSAGSCAKKLLAKGIIPNGVMIISSDKKHSEDFEKYFHISGIPVLGFKLKNTAGQKSFDAFSFCFSNKRKLIKNKISNGLNIIVVGENTNLDETCINNTFMQKKLIDLSNEVFNKNLAAACQSCENGIFSAILRLIYKKSWGIFINLNNLHKTEGDFSAWEYLSSSSTPERMIFAVQNWKLVEFIKIIDKYELPFSIIGKIDKSQSIKVIFKNSQVINLRKDLIFNPILKIDSKIPQSTDKSYEFCENISRDNVEKIIFNEKFLNKNNHFNSYVGNKTSFKSFENGLSELWYKDIKHYISTAINSDNLQFKVNPYAAGQNAVFENARKISAFGHKPLGINVNYNIDFESADIVNTFNKFKNGVLFASKKLGIKILNVKFSSAKETGFSILMMGKKKKRERLFVPYFDNAQKVYLIGKPDNLPATSSYQEILGGKIYPYPDEVNFKFENKLNKCIKKLQKENLISAIVPVERFGIAGALIKGLAPKKLGFKSERSGLNLNYLFNEIQSRFLVSSNSDIVPVLKKYKIPYILLGKTKSPDYIELGDVKLDCKKIYEN